jgi:hypothetical protein
LQAHRTLGTPQRDWSEEDLEGLAVDVEITDFPTTTRPARGRVIEILGEAEDFGTEHCRPMATEPTSQPSVRETLPNRRIGLEAQDQAVPCGRDQFGQGAQRRLTSIRLIGADDALCDVGPRGYFGLRQARVDTRFSQERA